MFCDSAFQILRFFVFAFCTFDIDVRCVPGSCFEVCVLDILLVFLHRVGAFSSQMAIYRLPLLLLPTLRQMPKEGLIQKDLASNNFHYTVSVSQAHSGSLLSTKLNYFQANAESKGSSKPNIA